MPSLHGFEVLPQLAESGAQWAFMSEVYDRTHGLLKLLQQHFRHVILVREHEDVPSENLQVLHLEGLMGIEVRNNLLQTRNQVAKRALDLTLAAVGFVLAIPVILVGAIGVKLADPGPAFYVQMREGYLGKPIKVWKLRTMHLDSEKRLDAHLEADPSARREWNDRFKLQDDPRVIPVVGRVLRRFSLDELPQLWAVIKGDMSLVGPRPFPGYHLETFPEEFRALRRRVRPGLTGLWQVMARSSGSVEEQEFYDTSYIRNWSLWLDIYVIARTALTVLFPKEASQLVAAKR
jgi:lipopolysaccharide/colanic/teichoic acid biosynthesis glycosyltransferase